MVGRIDFRTIPGEWAGVSCTRLHRARQPDVTRSADTQDMSVLMVRMIGLAGAMLFVGLLVVGFFVVLGALKEMVWDTRRRMRRAGSGGPRAGSLSEDIDRAIG